MIAISLGMILAMPHKKEDPQRYGPDAHTNIMLFPESWILLSQEIAHPFHQKLRDQLNIDAMFAEASFATNIACIATYVNVAVDGDYSQQDLDKLFGIIVKRMRRKRGMLDDIGSEIIRL